MKVNCEICVFSLASVRQINGDTGYGWNTVTIPRLDKYDMTFPFGRYNVGMIRRMPSAPNGLLRGMIISLMAGIQPTVYCTFLACCCVMIIVHYAAMRVLNGHTGLMIKL